MAGYDDELDGEDRDPPESREDYSSFGVYWQQGPIRAVAYFFIAVMVLLVVLALVR